MLADMAGFLRSFLTERRAIPWDKTVWHDSSFAESATGLDITPDAVFGLGDVYACVRVLAEAVAQLPLITYRRDGRNRDRARDHAVFPLLHSLPNPEITAFEMRETLMGHLALRGNAYAEIEWGSNGQIKHLWMLHPDKVTPRRVKRQLVYDVQVKSGPDQRLPGYRVLHLRGLSPNGIVGYSPIHVAAEEFGMALAGREYGARFYRNNGRPSGVLEYADSLSDDAFDKIKREWRAAYGGLSNAHRIAVLEEGVTYKQIGVKPEEAQFLESRKFSRSQIAAIFKVPAHMINDLERATFSNIEEMSLEFVIYTLTPWLVRWEQALSRDLLIPSERESMFIAFLVDALLRGDAKARYETYKTAIMHGIMSPNDAREKENMNAREGGDTYYMPLNMMPSNLIGSPLADQRSAGLRASQNGVNTVISADAVLPTTEARQLTDEQARQVASGRRRLAVRFEGNFTAVIASIMRREVNDVTNAARRILGQRSAAAFEDWLTDFYRNDHPAFIERQITPAMRSYLELVGDAAAEEVGADEEAVENGINFDAWLTKYVQAYASRHASRNLARVQRTLSQAEEDGADLVEAISADFESWPDERAESFARNETIRAGAAYAVALWAAVGVIYKRWVAYGDSCPYCTALNGQVVGIQRYFLDANVSFSPEGVDVSFTPSTNIGHAPAHQGCDCSVVAG